tara:strand:- start:186 stop:728 length:543 start_codon:yes stop_codon:yes gene_type:complete
MALIKTRARGLKLDDTFAFTGTVSGAGASNTPAFSVRKSSNQTLSHNSNTHITFDDEILDTDNGFASNTYTIPSGKSGKYLVGSTIKPNSNGDISEAVSMLYVNDSLSTTDKSIYTQLNKTNETTYTLPLSWSAVLDLSVGDTLKVYGSIYSIGGTSNTLTMVGDTNSLRSWFYGFRISE